VLLESKYDPLSEVLTRPATRGCWVNYEIAAKPRAALSCHHQQSTPAAVVDDFSIHKPDQPRTIYDISDITFRCVQ
jgi:hypothetical protein